MTRSIKIVLRRTAPFCGNKRAESLIVSGRAASLPLPWRPLRATRAFPFTFINKTYQDPDPTY